MKRNIVLVTSVLILNSCLSASLVDEEHTDAFSPRVIWSAATVLTAVDGQIGNGFAETEYRDDNTFSQAIRVNLLPTSNGKYDAWLIRENPSDVLHLGTLTSPNGDSTYFLNVQRIEDLRDHRKVIITWEPNGSETEGISDHIVEGTLRVVQSDQPEEEAEERCTISRGDCTDCTNLDTNC